MTQLEDMTPKHFHCRIEDDVAIISLDRPERKNPLTFESYAELRDWFRALAYADDVDAVVFASNGGNFSSGGDVHDIIGPLIEMDMKGLLAFTRMTGDLVKAMIDCGKPVDRRRRRRVRRRRRDHRHGLRHAPGDAGGQDRLPVHPRRPCRLRHGRLRHPAADHRPGPRRRTALHRPLDERRGRRALGLLQPRSSPPSDLEAEALALAQPHRGRAELRPHDDQDHAEQEWNMGLDQAIEAEAQAQAICMQTEDFGRAYEAFVAKQKPVFEGN